MGAESCDDRVCPGVRVSACACVRACVRVCVCPPAYLWKYTSDLYQFFCAGAESVVYDCLVIPAKAFARDYVITGVGLSVCLSVCLFVCLFVTTITK